MNRPDSNSSDPSANQDDAVWLDLVARLEGDTTGGTAKPTAGNRTDPGLGAPNEATDPHGGKDPRDGVTNPPAADGTVSGAAADTAAGTAAGGTAKQFSDFDPLGLAPRAGAPIELSAAERAAARQRAAETAGSDETATPEGPRDYEVDDEDDAFVPEDPPSLAGIDPLTMLAWLGAVGAPVALVLSAMFWRSAPLLAILGMVVSFVGAVVYLIMKLPQEKDENDDGARV
ncbi:hypothetical protein [Arthrobacter sp. NPDC093139]|uniref:hypothetical protein n=1 Tax=Arthrobacter sp. NPDC093139 TaxID=3363945 RepID=UPI00382474F2